MRQALAERALLAFDYDGTLAPITEQYEDASTPPAIMHSLDKLAHLRTVVIITGRSIIDVSSRLGFAPHAIVGNHGAEGLSAGDARHFTNLVAGWRSAIEATCGHDLREAGVVLEDKGLSLSLHYRQAQDVVHAQKIILHACSLLAPPARILGGKCVVNITPHGAPDKADALLALARAENTDTAIFVGDDLNDEAVFQRAPLHWLTVRVGQNEQSAARYYLERQEEIGPFIDTILGYLQHA